MAAGKGLTGDQAANLLTLTRRQVIKLANDNHLPRNGDSSYPFPAVVHAYIRYLRDRSVGQGGGGESPDVASERTRLTREQADKVALDNAQRRGELIPSSVIRVALDRTFTAFKSRIEAIPRKAVPRLKECETDASREKSLRGLCREALDELSRTDFDKLLPDDADGADGVDNASEAAAGPDGERVGRRVPDPVARGKRRARKVEHVSG
jgi:phage terminase Nu1 subunit (DNA packaging protein)